MSGIFRELGGTRTAARFVRSSGLAALGFYRHYQRIDWSQVRRLVFVCSGNICRSPYAVQRAAAAGFPSASFAIDAARGGAPADPTAIRVGLLGAVDLRAHVSTRIADFQFAAGDLLLAMEPRQLHKIPAFVGNVRFQMTLLGLWCNRAAPYIPDPYGLDDVCFERVFSLIDNAVANVIRRLGAAGGVRG